MIDVTELMSGNICRVIESKKQIDDNNEFIIYQRLEQDYGNQMGFQNSCDDGMIACYPFKCIEYVPITFELLTRFGFVDTIADHTKQIYYYNNFRSINITIDKDCPAPILSLGDYFSKERIDIISGTECKFVHQLQNIYYLLTGNRLILK